VVVRADLNGHLKALKDYFLLAKGDFFQVSKHLVNENIISIPSFYTYVFELAQDRFCATISLWKYGTSSDV
jgi:hypothetical protein